MIYWGSICKLYASYTEVNSIIYTSVKEGNPKKEMVRDTNIIHKRACRNDQFVHLSKICLLNICYLSSTLLSLCPHGSYNLVGETDSKHNCINYDKCYIGKEC